MEDTKECPETFGKRLVQYRNETGCTLEQLSGKLYISTTTIFKVESGKTDPSANMLHFLCRNTDCDVDWLVLGFRSDKVDVRQILTQKNVPPEVLRTDKRMYLYAVRYIQMNMVLDESTEEMADQDMKYRLNLKLAERVLEECDDNAEEGVILRFIRSICNCSARKMDDILGLKHDRYSYLEKNGRPTLSELNKLYDAFGVNPSFVLSGSCRNMMAINDLLKQF